MLWVAGLQRTEAERAEIVTAGARADQYSQPRHWAEQLSQIQIISGASVILTGLVWRGQSGTDTRMADDKGSLPPGWDMKFDARTGKLWVEIQTPRKDSYPYLQLLHQPLHQDNFLGGS